MREACCKSLSRQGFTLVELLIVIAVVAVLISLAVPALTGVRRSAAQAREISSARQLVAAYNAYALDHDGRLMPGYYNPQLHDGHPPLHVLDEDGNPLPPNGEEAKRYPWRIAPYVGFDMRGLVADTDLLQQLQGSMLPSYYLSLHPMLGMNSIFVGGDDSTTSGGAPYVGIYGGPLHVSRLSRVRRPADLIVFASARGLLSLPGFPQLVTEGYFRIRPPYIQNPDGEWADVFQEQDPPGAFGNVSLRHINRSAAVGFLDGSAGALTEVEIQDMRHWADQATSPIWTITAP